MSILDETIKIVADCPCGRKHIADFKNFEMGSRIVGKTGEILRRDGFFGRLLLVADKNTLSAADGILPSLEASGFKLKMHMYDDLRTAEMEQVNVIETLCGDVDGVLSVGTGSLNDICRLGAYRANKPLAIFATAPSMDGFASGTAPIIDRGFKMTRQACQPRTVIADTAVLAAAPDELKAAGFGDMAAKYIALVDWKVSHLLTGEHFCPRIAGITLDAVERITRQADKLRSADEKAAAAVMEALILTGVTMQLEDSVRPASGAEHIVSHFWEVKKLEAGKLSDFHGKKVGVATLAILRLYKYLASFEKINPTPDNTDWDKVFEIYGENLSQDVKKLNNPTVTDGISPERISENWEEIRRAVSELPDETELLSVYKAAGAATTLDEIAVDRQLGIDGLAYHSYMRHRLTLARLTPMLGIPVDWESFLR